MASKTPAATAAAQKPKLKLWKRKDEKATITEFAEQPKEVEHVVLDHAFTPQYDIPKRIFSEDSVKDLAKLYMQAIKTKEPILLTIESNAPVTVLLNPYRENSQVQTPEEFIDFLANKVSAVSIARKVNPKGIDAVHKLMSAEQPLEAWHDRCGGQWAEMGTLGDAAYSVAEITRLADASKGTFKDTVAKERVGERGGVSRSKAGDKKEGNE